MNQRTGIPVPPPERRLPDHRRRREELLRMLDDEVLGNGLRRRWTLPVGVAAAVTATGVAAAIAFGGGATKGATDRPAGPGARGGTPTTSAALLGKPLPASVAQYQRPGTLAVSVGQHCLDQTSGGAVPKVDPGYTFVGQAGDQNGVYCLEQPIGVQATPAANPPVIALGDPEPIPADQVAAILKSCLGEDAAKVTPVLAERTAIATTQQDGVVVARDGQGRYVACNTLGTVGRSSVQPPYITLEQHSGATDKFQIQDFYNSGEITGPDRKTQLIISVGHYGAKVARVTVSYGTNPAEYPALMENGVYFLSAGTTAQPDHPEATMGFVHAYDASGKVLYNEVTGVPAK